MNFKIDESYIRGFGDADGTCQGNIISLSNSNRELLLEIGFALREIGIKNGLYENSKVIISVITNKPHKKSYRLSISGVDNLSRYAILIGFNIDYKMNNLISYIRSQCVNGKPGNLKLYYKYLDMKNVGYGVTKMASLLNMTLSNLQWRIKHKYPFSPETIRYLEPFQP